MTKKKKVILQKKMKKRSFIKWKSKQGPFTTNALQWMNRELCIDRKYNNHDYRECSVWIKKETLNPTLTREKRIYNDY